MDWASNNLKAYHQTAGGGLAAPVPIFGPHAGWNALKIADINGDGRKDIVVGSQQNLPAQRLGVLLQRADGSFEPPHYPPYAFGPFAPAGIGVLDVNGDGTKDIVATQAWNQPNARLIVLFNQGGSYANSIEVPSYDIPEPVRIADVNMDGFEDVVVLHGGWNEAGVYTRAPGGGLDAELLFPIPYASHYGPQGLAIGDVNGDGRPDLVIADYNSGLVLLYNLTGACTSFGDVDASSPFCGNVEWLRNRAITLGCSSATLYCPNDSVLRLAMAAFMNRLGTALTAIVLPQQAMTGALDPGASPVVCATADWTETGFPRRVFLDSVFTATAIADVGLAADLVVSFDSGVTWLSINTQGQRGLVRANRWGNLRSLGNFDVAPGLGWRVGLRVNRGGLPGAATLSDSSCNLRVRIDNRNGELPPF